MRMIPLESPNYFDPAEIGLQPIRALCLHGTAGPLQASLAWLRNPQPQNPPGRVSACYLVSRAGVIYELVNPFHGRRAFANGVVRKPDPSVKWLQVAIAKKVNPNYLTISIEHEASWDDMVKRGRMTDLQWAASQELAGYLLSSFDLKANHETIVTHSQIDSVNKPFCPGVIFAPSYTEELIKRFPNLKG